MKAKRAEPQAPSTAVPTSPHVRRPDPRAAEPAPQSAASDSSEQIRTGQLSGEQIRSEIVHLAQPAVWTRVSLPSGLSEANRSSARARRTPSQRCRPRSPPRSSTPPYGDGSGPGGPRGNAPVRDKRSAWKMQPVTSPRRADSVVDGSHGKAALHAFVYGVADQKVSDRGFLTAHRVISDQPLLLRAA